MVDDSKKVAWNASEGLIMEISNRRSYANSFYIQGDYKKAFATLVSIKQSVIQSFHEEERDKLKEIEDKFNKISFALTKNNATSFNSKNVSLFIQAKNIAEKIYNDYNNYLMDLLEDRDYLIGEKTDASKMKF